MWLFSLAFAEMDVAEHVLVEGPMSRGNLASMRERWTSRLANFTKGLEEERQKYVKEYQKAADETKAKIQAARLLNTIWLSRNRSTDECCSLLLSPQKETRAGVWWRQTRRAPFGPLLWGPGCD